MLMVMAVPGDSVAVKTAIVGFVRRTKYASIGHMWWLMSVLSKPEIFHLAVFDVTDGKQTLKALYSFYPEGKEEASLVLAYSDSTMKELLESRKLVKDELRKAGITRVNTVVWGPYERGLATARLWGGQVRGTLVTIPV